MERRTRLFVFQGFGLVGWLSLEAVDLEEPAAAALLPALREPGKRASGPSILAAPSAQSGRRGYPSFSLWRLGVLGFWSKKARLPTIVAAKSAAIPQRRSRRYGINPSGSFAHRRCGKNLIGRIMESLVDVERP